MQDKNNLEANLTKLQQEKSKLESELASLKQNKQTLVLEKLKSVSCNTYPSVFDKPDKFGSRDLYFAHKGGLKSCVADKFENYQAVDFCYKSGVKLVVDDGLDARVARGGEGDLYGVCIDYDEFSRTATVVSIASSFECVLLASDDVKAGDRLVFDELGVLKRVDNKNTYMHAIALSDALQFKDKVGCYGARVMLISKPIKKAS
ncbi:hypothetical protein DB313_04810 (plasmid) [Borrelia turcica IST7]|uniref:DUF228 domain-containing protein n=1 Tax=Borrelia turcica IST7 TaxID=1104446 RepID=A0A386PNE8_9SPIR|nr:DUF228 domain-containing protein [Borrelia turcica]AYE36822.1 hypothetical protein DB313_04810 [Borrelia turcica IST7]